MEQEEGYPTDEALLKIENWDANDPLGLWEYIKDYFNDHGRAWVDGEDYKLATGGWSGCESVIQAIEDNFTVRIRRQIFPSFESSFRLAPP